MLCLRLSCPAGSRGGRCKFWDMGGILGGVNDLLVPIESWCLVNECCPFRERCIRPLGYVQIVDHLAGGSSGTVAH